LGRIHENLATAALNPGRGKPASSVSKASNALSARPEDKDVPGAAQFEVPDPAHKQIPMAFMAGSNSSPRREPAVTAGRRSGLPPVSAV